MRCKCGCMMIWNIDYVNGISVSWYTCPSCGYDTRNQQYIWSDKTYKAESEETETWNGIHAQITAPKGTFDKIWEDAKAESEE